jgi:hypothetical protein
MDMTSKTTRMIGAAALLSLSGCATVRQPEHGFFLSAGMAENDIRISFPLSNSIRACSLSPQLHEATSVHVEYQPQLNGHIGSVIAGATWHF